MRLRTTHLPQWKSEASQLAFWLSTTIVAGSIPEIAGSTNLIYLVAVGAFSVIAASFIWIRTKRRSGVGVYIHISPESERANKHKLLQTVSKEMQRRHKEWFRSGPYLRGSAVNHAGWTFETISHRLTELEARNTIRSPVYLYIYCRLVDAFDLGQEYNQHFSERTAELDHTYTHPIGNPLPVSSQVRSLSTYNGASGQMYGLNISSLTKDPRHAESTCAPTVSAPPVVNLREKFDSTSPAIPRMALVIHVGPIEYSVKFWDLALQAASGCNSNGYMITNDDHCDHAVKLSIDPDDLIPQLIDHNAEQYVQTIYKYWQDSIARLYGDHQVPARIFTNCPAIVAFALGTLLPPGSKLIRFDPTFTSGVSQQSEYSHGEIVAIIDGDDVGTRTELELLSGRLDNAVNYSRAVDSALSYLATELARIPGLELLSTGGDSAIAAFPAKSLHAFNSTITRLRDELQINLSCGYAADCRDAYISLRIAKTSGKNVTVGFGDRSPIPT